MFCEYGMTGYNPFCEYGLRVEKTFCEYGLASNPFLSILIY
jgi:hypothetical protein